LAPYSKGLAASLTMAGYAPSTREGYDRLLAKLSDWLTSHGIAPAQFDVQASKRFAASHRRVGVRETALSPLLDYLRQVQAIPATPPDVDDPIDQVLAGYRTYLQRERRLAPLTVWTAVGVIRRFLLTRSRSGPLELTRLSVGEVHAFVLAEAGRLSVGATRAELSALRSFLAYLFASGILAHDLGVTIPGVAGWRLGTLPRAVDTPTLTALFASCDRTSSVGRRDFAVLTVLVRLGLRAIEVAAMRLEDLDWRAGELVVHGKGGRTERLPLPADVGAALADYLRHGRGRSPNRAVFLRVMAPAGPMSRNAVVMVPRTASRRAGIDVVGCHRLRHTAATGMLRGGASLREVGQVLRHNSDTTTAVYAKVDRNALDLVVRAWPEPAR
jgi:site-specific recombinase XerD